MLFNTWQYCHTINICMKTILSISMCLTDLTTSVSRDSRLSELWVSPPSQGSRSFSLCSPLILLLTAESVKLSVTSKKYTTMCVQHTITHKQLHKWGWESLVTSKFLIGCMFHNITITVQCSNYVKFEILQNDEQIWKLMREKVTDQELCLNLAMARFQWERSKQLNSSFNFFPSWKVKY